MASSQPATSENFTLGRVASVVWALVLPNAMAPELGSAYLLMK